MESTVDRIPTATETPLLPQVFPHTSRDRFEQACKRLTGFSELAQTWRGLLELSRNFDTGAKHGLGEYVQALDMQFTQAFIKSFPSVGYMTDFLQLGLDAIHEGKAEALAA